ncbi:MAG: type III PLP-dependent enzyme [Gammaproteobacteria bacterium]|nr:type III PLP-dependent enzyme [Gammaproteobacteria bacterium]
MTTTMTHQLNAELSRYKQRTMSAVTSNVLGEYRDIAQVVSQLQPDFPVHCFSPDDLRERVQLFLNNFPGQVGFAVKSNGEALIIEHLIESGIQFFDAASIAEIELVRSFHESIRILYDNPIKSRDEIEKAYYQYGVRSFALDDEIEFEKIQSIVDHDPSVQLSVRFKIKGSFAAQDLNTKFGASPEQAIELLDKINHAGYKAALTFHPGSQCYSPSAYKDFIYAAAMIAEKAEVKINMLNVGGGFPAQYLNSDTPPLLDFFLAIEEQFKRYFSRDECELVCEPGRALVVSSGTLLCRVKHRRQDNTIFLNDGIYGGFMEQLVAFFKLPVKVYRNSKLVLDSADDFKVYGPTCDPTDCFQESISLPASVQEGDYIEFGLTGAYGSATTTRFNGYSSDKYVIVKKASHFPE